MTLAADGEEIVRKTLDGFRSMASVLHDRSFPLERRREILRRPLPERDGQRPIRVLIDPSAPWGWRNALKRIVVRRLAIGLDEPREQRCQASLVSPAVAAEAEQARAPGRDPAAVLPAWDHEILADDIEEVGKLVGAGSGADSGW